MVSRRYRDAVTAVAFVSFQSRLLRGLRLLGGEDVPQALSSGLRPPSGAPNRTR
ncbi:hypothetical protein ERHA55_51690 (plasmid) [Erwinia rhapontici]|nr:hypothetical protein ERHA55_51690 [Erwinia rhapontici]